MHPLRCPACRGLDWYRDGFVISEDEAGAIEARRAELGAMSSDSVWSCMLCGHEVPGWASLAKSLDAMRELNVEQPQSLEQVRSEAS